MRNYFKTLFMAGAMISLALTGCNKADDATPENPTNNTGSAPSVTMSDGYGVMAAVKSVSYTTVAGITVPVEVNTAVAAFSSSMGSSTFVDAGTVTINSKSLTKSSNNAYAYQNLTDPLSFGTVTWNVAGSGSVPAISYTDNKPFPDYSGFSSLPSTITRSAGLTVSLGSAVSNADSIYVIVTDYDKHTLIKRLAGNAAQCVIGASELAGFTAGQGMLQVVPWSYKDEDFNDKKFYFVLEAAYTKQGLTIN